MKWTADVLASVAAPIENDQWVTVRELATMHGLLVGNVHSIFNDNLDLVKKSLLAESLSWFQQP
jgi:hypothetical protein